MKIFIPLTCLVALIFAEPPVDDGYAATRSSHDHDHHHDSDHHHGPDHQRTLSQEYGAPFERAFGARDSLATEYGPPSARSSISQEYGLPGLRNAPSNTYLPAARISQEYGAPGLRSLSEEYVAPSSRGLSQEYGVPNARSGSSQQYDASSIDSTDSYPAARSPSAQYGVPELRSNPSETYGAPAQRNFGSPFPTQKYGIPRGSSSGRYQFRSNTASQGYSAPIAKSAGTSQGYSTPRNSFKSSLAPRTPSQAYGSPRNAPSQTYGAPASRSLSTSYGAPSARNSESYSHGGKSVSQSYGPPSHKEQADTIEVVSARGLSQEHGAPGQSGNLKTDAVVSSYAAARHAAHGASGHDMPSEQYGVPQQYSAQDDQGYNYPRARLDEQLNEEPAGYDFAYKVEDYESGSDFGHQETREENRAEGSYFVVLPDGTKQTVEYEADEDGFKPRISLERAVISARAGYDENSQDLSSSAGPY